MTIRLLIRTKPASNRRATARASARLSVRDRVGVIEKVPGQGLGSVGGQQCQRSDAHGHEGTRGSGAKQMNSRGSGVRRAARNDGRTCDPRCLPMI